MAANFTDKEVECPLLKEWGVPVSEDGADKSRDNGAKLLIHNYNDLPSRQKLRPYEAMMWEKQRQQLRSDAWKIVGYDVDRNTGAINGKPFARMFL